MPSFHCTRAVLPALVAAINLSVAFAQQLPPIAPPLAEPASNFTIFFRTLPVGSEQIAVTRSADGWTITGSGRLGAPLDIVTRRLQVRYDSNWKPIELTIDATVRGQARTLHSTVNGNTITNQSTSGAESATTTATTEADVVLTTLFFAPYEALAARLRTIEPGATIAGYVALEAPISIKVVESTSERIQTARQLIDVRRSHVVITPIGVGATVEAEIWGDANGRLLRLSVPAQSLEVVREDVASVAARRVPISRPSDEQVRIPSNGFSLAGTISKPANLPGKPLPAVVFVGGSGGTDRDEFLFGIPILGQLAGVVADAGFITLRYDKRGVGQSGGRIESGTFGDLAEDLRAAVKLLSERRDVDAKRIAVVGHSEGGSVALVAAANQKRIAAVGLLATNGVSGPDLILEQQQHALGRSNLSESDKQARVALQKRINDAVITGKGWEQLPPEVRRQADDAEFQSILTHDPAKVVPDVRQPILIVQGELDTQVAPANADRLQALARKRKNASAVDVVKVPGVNHLLVPATTGESDEYATLKEKQVSPAVSGALVGWLQKTLAAK